MPKQRNEPVDLSGLGLTETEVEKLEMLDRVLKENGLNLQPEGEVLQPQLPAVQTSADPVPPVQPLIPLPTVGRIVHFYLSNDQVRPAIITNVHYAEVVDLQVFTNGQTDRQLIPERMVMVNVRTGADQHVVPPVVHRAGVLMGPAAGHWMWPARS